LTSAARHYPRAMHLRALAAVCAVCALPVTAARADDRVVATGVTVQGVDLSGQTVDQASATLAAQLAPHLSRDVVVNVGAQQFRLRADQAGFAFDTLLTAKRAFYAGQKAAGQPVAVAPAVKHMRVAVRGWAEVVRKRVTRPARDATARITVAKIFTTHSRAGLSVDTKALSAAVDKSFDDATAPRRFRQPVVRWPRRSPTRGC